MMSDNAPGDGPFGQGPSGIIVMFAEGLKKN